MRELRERYPRPDAQLAPSSAGPVLLATRTQADTALTRPSYRPPGHQPCRPQGRRHRRPPPTLQRPRRHPSAGLYWASQAREPDSPALCRGPGRSRGRWRCRGMLRMVPLCVIYEGWVIVKPCSAPGWWQVLVAADQVVVARTSHLFGRNRPWCRAAGAAQSSRRPLHPKATTHTERARTTLPAIV
jgi:hypothetical protein